MEIGLIDVDSHNFPNLLLMKISAWHKAQGDNVEFVDNYFKHYDKVYVSKVFGDEYTTMDATVINADEIVYGGTGFAITIENGKEVYHKDRDPNLPYEIEHIYPDYSLYPELTKNKAFGFLSRGCCNNCEFCLVSKKEGLCSVKVADLDEWWSGQKQIVLMDPNILACKNREELLQQLINSKAKVEFNQGLDARFITPQTAKMLKQINTKMWHFAFDKMGNAERVVKGLKMFIEVVNPPRRNCCVYVLTNFNTKFCEDYWRITEVQKLDLNPDVRIYRKNSLPKRCITKDLQRWCNNRVIYNNQQDFWKYEARGKTMMETYPQHYAEWIKYKEERDATSGEL